MPEIFISYAREDRQRAEKLFQAFQRKGWTVWMDDKKIRTGEKYVGAIEAALQMACCVVVVWSHWSIKSDWVMNEAAVGLKENKLFPVTFDDIEPPLNFRHLQTANFSDLEGYENSSNFIKFIGDLNIKVEGVVGAEVEVQANLGSLFMKLKNWLGLKTTPKYQVEKSDEIGVVSCQRKISLVGTFGVGKTSLVRRYVTSIFDEKYHSTIGVKIDQKTLMVNQMKVMLVIWDIAGEEENYSIPMSYVKGSDGLMFVIDGTRPQTLETALSIYDNCKSTCGRLPSVFLLNKFDLADEWRITDSLIEKHGLSSSNDWKVFYTSAKTGYNVDEAFLELGLRILKP